MTISMFEASSPRFINMLKNLSAILAKAEAHATARKIAPEVLLYKMEARCARATCDLPRQRRGTNAPSLSKQILRDTP